MLPSLPAMPNSYGAPLPVTTRHFVPSWSGTIADFIGLRSILRNDSEAEDVVQEAYITAFTRLGGFRGDSSLAT
jgi:hypothetical protein